MDDDLTTSALKALRRILRASDLSNRQLAAATGLTPSQLLVLKEVAERDESTPTALSAALQFSQPTVTNILNRLEADSLVARQRSDQDRRQIFLTPTARGKAVIGSAPDLLQARFADGFAALPEWEQAMILAGLRRLADILGIASTDAAPLLDSGAIDRPFDR